MIKTMNLALVGLNWWTPRLPGGRQGNKYDDYLSNSAVNWANHHISWKIKCRLFTVNRKKWQPSRIWPPFWIVSLNRKFRLVHNYRFEVKNLSLSKHLTIEMSIDLNHEIPMKKWDNFLFSRSPIVTGKICKRASKNPVIARSIQLLFL